MCIRDSLQRFEGNYSDFLEHQRRQERQPTAAKPASGKPKAASKPASTGPRRRSFKEAKELEQQDKQLPQLEQQRGALAQRLSAGQGDITELSVELAALLHAIGQAEERWLELSELAP